MCFSRAREGPENDAPSLGSIGALLVIEGKKNMRVRHTAMYCCSARMARDDRSLSAPFLIGLIGIELFTHEAFTPSISGQLQNPPLPPPPYLPHHTTEARHYFMANHSHPLQHSANIIHGFGGPIHPSQYSCCCALLPAFTTLYISDSLL